MSTQQHPTPRFSVRLASVSLLALTTFLLGGCGQLMKIYDDKTRVSDAERRIEIVMEGILSGESETKNDRYRSISEYFRGIKHIDSGNAGPASDDFDRFLRKKKIFPTIESYEITGSELVTEDEDFSYVKVSLTVNGKKELKIQVPEGQPLKWTK